MEFLGSWLPVTGNISKTFMGTKEFSVEGRFEFLFALCLERYAHYIREMSSYV